MMLPRHTCRQHNHMLHLQLLSYATCQLRCFYAIFDADTLMLPLRCCRHAAAAMPCHAIDIYAIRFRHIFDIDFFLFRHVATRMHSIHIIYAVSPPLFAASCHTPHSLIVATL